MSTEVRGSFTQKKKGRTVSKIVIANKKKRDKKPHLISPAKAAEFIARLKALAKRYHIDVRNLRVG